MGRIVFEAALADPDSLADVVDIEQEYEAEIYGVARQALEEKDLGPEEFDWAYKANGKRRRPRLRGRSWDLDDDRQVSRRLPRLAALYLTDEDEDSQ